MFEEPEPARRLRGWLARRLQKAWALRELGPPGLALEPVLPESAPLYRSDGPADLGQHP